MARRRAADCSLEIRMDADDKRGADGREQTHLENE